MSMSFLEVLFWEFKNKTPCRIKTQQGAYYLN